MKLRVRTYTYSSVLIVLGLISNLFFAFFARNSCLDFSQNHCSYTLYEAGYSVYETHRSVLKEQCKIDALIPSCHPPTANVLLYPLLILPFKWGCGILSLLFVFFHFKIIGFSLSFISLNPEIKNLLLAGSFLWTPLILANFLRNTNMIISFLLVMYLKFLLQKKDSWSGISLGAAIALKPHPLIYLPMLLLLKRIRVIKYAFVSFGLLFFISIAKFGFRSWFEFIKRARICLEYYRFSIDNISIRGLIEPLFSIHERNFISPIVPIPFEYVSVACTILILIVLSLSGILMLFLRFGFKGLADNVRICYFWTLSSFIIILVPSLSWQHILHLLLPIFAMLWISIEDEEHSSSKWHKLLLIGLILTFCSSNESVFIFIAKGIKVHYAYFLVNTKLPLLAVLILLIMFLKALFSSSGANPSTLNRAIQNISLE